MTRRFKFSNRARLALLAVFVAIHQTAAAAVLHSEVDAKRFSVGEGFVLTLAITGAKQVEPPDFPALPDFFTRALEPQILEQGADKTYIYRYRMIPRRAGVLTLPPMTVTADGGELREKSRALEVSDPQATPALRVELALDHATVYVGQPVGVTFRMLTSLTLTGLKAMDLRLPLLYDPDFDVIVPAAERIAAGQPDTIGLPVEGQRVIGSLSTVQINEEQFAVITFRRILVPTKAGEFKIAPARLLCSYLAGADNRRRNLPQYPSYFDNDFFQDVGPQEAYVRYGARSDGLTLKVRPLPATGRPPDFSGVVGHGELVAAADPQTLVIGDPVTLTVRLRGFPMPEAVTLRPLAKLADFDGQFLVPEAQAPPRVQTGEAVYVQSVRPLRTAVAQVPALKLVVFNPENGRYETLATRPIPLRIRPDGDITAIDLGPDKPSGRRVNSSGIWHNLPPDAVDPLTRAGRLAAKGAPVWLLLPALLFFALAGPARRHRLKRADPQRWRQVTAFARLRRALRRAPDPGAQRAAVAAYLAMRLEIQAAALTEREVLRALESRRIDATDELRICLRELLLRADLHQFGRERGQPAVLLDNTRLLAALGSLEGRLDR